MVKKLISLFLLLALSITFLPLQEVGKLLCSNQLVEELSPEVHDNKPMNSFGKEIIHYHSEFNCIDESVNHKQLTFLLLHDIIPSHPSVEIHVPPPNFL